MRRSTVLYTCLLLLLLALWPRVLAAQRADPAIVVQARVDRVEMRVGDQLTYELIVVAPPEAEIILPSIPNDEFGAWEVRSCEALPPDDQFDDGVRSGWQCVLTIWTVGDHDLPVLEVGYNSADGSGSVQTQPLSVRVVSVLDQTATDIKPLKPQLVMNDPSNLLMLIGLALLALLVLAATALGFIYYRRMMPVPATVSGPTPVVDPVDVALRELDRIGRLQLVEEGRIAEHYTLIADTLRSYIRHLFGIPALERTTTEISSALRGDTERARPDHLVSLLAEADGVKFARYTPSAEEAQRMLERAREAILASRER